METCSLACVRAHKVKTSCTGQRDKTAYVKLSNFDESNLLNDYRFLEDVSRKTDVSNRDPLLAKYNTTNTMGRTRMVTRIKNEKNVTWKLLPQSFTRCKRNTTRLNMRNKTLVWHVEWIFPEIRLKFNHRLNDRIAIADILKGIITWPGHDSLTMRQLRSYTTAVEEGGLHIMLKKADTPANQPLFQEVDTSLDLETILKSKTIIEYPVLYVVLGEEAKRFPLVDDISNDSSPLEELSCEAASVLTSRQKEYREASCEEFREINPHAEKTLWYDYMGKGYVERQLIVELKDGPPSTGSLTAASDKTPKRKNSLITEDDENPFENEDNSQGSEDELYREEEPTVKISKLGNEKKSPDVIGTQQKPGVSPAALGKSKRKTGKFSKNTDLSDHQTGTVENAVVEKINASANEQKNKKKRKTDDVRECAESLHKVDKRDNGSNSSNFSSSLMPESYTEYVDALKVIQNNEEEKKVTHDCTYENGHVFNSGGDNNNATPVNKLKRKLSAANSLHNIEEMKLCDKVKKKCLVDDSFKLGVGETREIVTKDENEETITTWVTHL